MQQSIINLQRGPFQVAELEAQFMPTADRFVFVAARPANTKQQVLQRFLVGNDGCDAAARDDLGSVSPRQLVEELAEHTRILEELDSRRLAVNRHSHADLVRLQTHVLQVLVEPRTRGLVGIVH